MAEIQFLSLLFVLSIHGTVSAGTAGRPRLAHPQEQLDNLKGQFEQFRQDINTKLDQSVSARLERLERKIEEISPSVTTTPTTGPVEAGANGTSAGLTTTGGIPKLPRLYGPKLPKTSLCGQMTSTRLVFKELFRVHLHIQYSI